jgi:hypothetical protein
VRPCMHGTRCEHTAMHTGIPCATTSQLAASLCGQLVRTLHTPVCQDASQRLCLAL